MNPNKVFSTRDNCVYEEDLAARYVDGFYKQKEVSPCQVLANILTQVYPEKKRGQWQGEFSPEIKQPETLANQKFFCL